MSIVVERERERNPTAYEEWIRGQSVPVYGIGEERDVEYIEHNGDIYGEWVPDPMAIELDDWERVGGRGAYIKLWCYRQFVDTFVLEIPARDELNAQKHLWEQQYYVLDGSGTMVITDEEGEESVLEWSMGDIFAVPLNYEYKMYNTGNESATLLGISTAPNMINCFDDLDFILDNDYVFSGRYSKDLLGSEKKEVSPTKTTTLLESLYFNNIKGRNLYDEELERKYNLGVKKAAIHWVPPQSLVGHTAHWPAGSYAPAHKHPTATGLGFIILQGDAGYTQVWDGPVHVSEAEFSARIPYGEHTVWALNTDLWHQHFGVGQEDARYYAWYLGNRKRPGFGGWFKRWAAHINIEKGGWSINFDQEDPVIFEQFKEELEKRGNEMMDPDEWRRADTG